ncbi:hypothetical protein [Gelidibacter pelagius]|uniref:Uncharacterized protein n=1 Tax=Gelidibacter pelagius TaxID=2819985 RepID=A0ABS3SMD7_9FLAO|nr:hypothetical protein [Gelidibacter pelagius]MBO3096799.1 hypothetical protein [Gelidibacter pelagius]
MNLDGLVGILVLLLFGPAILFAIIGFILLFAKKRKAAKVLFIMAVVYVIISLSICGGMGS